MQNQVFKSSIFKIESKSKKSKMKELSLLEEGDIIGLEVNFNSIIKPANHYSTDVTIKILNRNMKFTRSQGIINNLISKLELKVYNELNY